MSLTSVSTSVLNLSAILPSVSPLTTVWVSCCSFGDVSVVGCSEREVVGSGSSSVMVASASSISAGCGCWILSVRTSGADDASGCCGVSIGAGAS